MRSGVRGSSIPAMPESARPADASDDTRIPFLGRHINRSVWGNVEGIHINCAETVWVHVCIDDGIEGKAKPGRSERLAIKMLRGDPVNEREGC